MLNFDKRKFHIFVSTLPLIYNKELRFDKWQVRRQEEFEVREQRGALGIRLRIDNGAWNVTYALTCYVITCHSRPMYSYYRRRREKRNAFERASRWGSVSIAKEIDFSVAAHLVERVLLEKAAVLEDGHEQILCEPKLYLYLTVFNQSYTGRYQRLLTDLQRKLQYTETNILYQ